MDAKSLVEVDGSEVIVTYDIWKAVYWVRLSYLTIAALV